MIHLSGEERFPQEPSHVWARLTDVKFLAEVMPGLDSVERVESELLACRVRPGFAFLKGTLKVTLEIIEKRSPDSARMRVTSKGIGFSATVETSVELLPADAGTRLTWTADVKELGGLLKTVPRTLIEVAARKVISDAWIGFRNELPGWSGSE